LLITDSTHTMKRIAVNGSALTDLATEFFFIHNRDGIKSEQYCFPYS
jgi:hypothetical protein